MDVWGGGGKWISGRKEGDGDCVEGRWISSRKVEEEEEEEEEDSEGDR